MSRTLISLALVSHWLYLEEKGAAMTGRVIEHLGGGTRGRDGAAVANLPA